MQSIQDTTKQLEAFVINNPLLEQLEGLIAEFNIFEALGMVRQELRHSDFLAFLLNPKEKHGFGDTFLKQFLIAALSEADEAPVSPITINTTNLSECTVERETQNIDILLHDRSSGLVCLIENKIFSDEHNDQLNRYLQIVRRRFPSASGIIPIFLTPDGIPPADENSLYIPFNYGQVAEVIERVRSAKQSMIGEDINTLIYHYIVMLRRHVVSDSDIAKLCQRIYETHKSAIDLIIEHMPDLRQELADYLIGLVSDSPPYQKVRFSKSYIDASLTDWASVPEFNVGIGWANSHSTIALEFWNGADGLNLYLQLGPVAEEHQYIRERIFAYARRYPDVFRGCRPNLSPQWTILYKLPLLNKNHYQDAGFEDLVQIIQPRWERFVADTLPQINHHLMQIKFE